MAFNYRVFFDGKIADLSVANDELKFSGGKSLVIRKNYVTSFELLQQLPMAKVAVEMAYYDFFGDKNTLRFDMHQSEFKALKNDLKK